MLPTLRSGDRLLIRYRAAPRPGKMVVVRLPDRPVAVKRAAQRVGDGWDVRSDNAVVGTDSRVFGAIPGEDVLAVVICRWWPLRRPRSRRP
jgi:type IV secretory pathway protease TraF